MYRRSSYSLFIGHGIVIGAVLFAVLHVLGTLFYLYWFYSWFDTVMHLIGGLWVGAVVVWAVHRYPSFSPERTFFSALVVTFCVSVLWELFEIHVGYVDPSRGSAYWIDTFSDITAGTLGGACAGLSALYGHYREKS